MLHYVVEAALVYSSVGITAKLIPILLVINKNQILPVKSLSHEILKEALEINHMQ